MFDRIAGVYDVMNSVMTAGMHHRWRERAADLARLSPGDSRARRGHRHRRPGARAGAARRARAAASSGRTSPRGCSSSRARRAARSSWEWGNALDLQYEDDSFDAATVGFGARNFSDLGAGLREMARVVRPGGRVVVLEITTPQKPPLSFFFRAWFDTRRAGARAGGRATPTPTPTCRLGAPLPGPARAGAPRWPAAGLRDVGWILTAGGIIAIHHGTVRVSAPGAAAARADPRGRRRRAARR